MRLSGPLINLLAITMRLHDLYLLKRSESDQAFAPQDVKRKKRDGKWLEVGAVILSLLHKKDEHSPESYTGLDDIHSEIQKIFSINREDTLTIIKYLHTPCELNFPTFEPHSIYEQTALIEPAIAGSGYRITGAGRTLFSHLNIARRLDYAPDMVSMLFKDLEHGRFVEFSQNCSQLTDLIREHSLKVMKIIEHNTAYDQYRAEVLGASERHLELLEELSDNLGELFKKLRSPEIELAVESHSDKPNSSQYATVASLHIDLKRVDQATGALLRNLSTLYQSFHHRKGKGPIAFDLKEVTARFWSGDLKVKQVCRAMLAHGFWTLHTSTSSLFDVPRRLSLPSLPSEDVVLETPKAAATGDALYAFLNKHWRSVGGKLEQGPVSLSSIFQTENIKDISEITGFFGLCFNPDILVSQGVKGRVIVSKGSDAKAKANLGSEGKFQSDDIQIEIKDGGDKQ